MRNPYGSNLDWDEVAKREKKEREKTARELSERGARTAGPPLEPAPGMIDPRFPPQQVVILPDPPRRGPGGSLPEADNRSEAEKLRDPVNLLRRIDHLERCCKSLGEYVNSLHSRLAALEGRI